MSPARAGLAAILVLSSMACSQGRPSRQADARGASPDPGRPLPSPLPEIVARVDGRPIALRQVLPLAKRELARLPAGEKEKQLPSALRRALDAYVDRELLLQEALARGISVDRRIVEWGYDQARRGQADETAWRAQLAAEGLDEQSLRAELRVQRTVSALLEREVREAAISDDAVRAFYDADPLKFAAPGATAAPAFASVRPQVETALRQAKRAEIVAALVARLRAKTRVELLL